MALPLLVRTMSRTLLSSFSVLVFLSFLSSCGHDAEGSTDVTGLTRSAEGEATTASQGRGSARQARTATSAESLPGTAQSWVAVAENDILRFVDCLAKSGGDPDAEATRTAIAAAGIEEKVAGELVGLARLSLQWPALSDLARDRLSIDRAGLPRGVVDKVVEDWIKNMGDSIPIPPGLRKQVGEQLSGEAEKAKGMFADADDEIARHKRALATLAGFASERREAFARLDAELFDRGLIQRCEDPGRATWIRLAVASGDDARVTRVLDVIERMKQRPDGVAMPLTALLDGGSTAIRRRVLFLLSSDEETELTGPWTLRVLESMADPDQQVSFAASALVRAWGGRGIPPLLAALSSQRGPRMLVAERFADAVEQTRAASPECRAMVETLLKDQDPTVVAAARRAALAAGIANRGVFDEVMQQLRSQDPQTKMAAIRQLGQLGDHAAEHVDALLDHTSDPDPMVSSMVWGLILESPAALKAALPKLPAAVATLAPSFRLGIGMQLETKLEEMGAPAKAALAAVKQALSTDPTYRQMQAFRAMMPKQNNGDRDR